MNDLIEKLKEFEEFLWHRMPVIEEGYETPANLREERTVEEIRDKFLKKFNEYLSK